MGPTGPTGATGVKGETGSTGATGPAGNNGTGDGVNYTFSAETAFGNPGTGKLRFNNSNPAEATWITAHKTDGDGADVAAWLASADESTGTPPSYLMVRSESEPQDFHIFEVESLAFATTEYDLFIVAEIAGQGTFSAGEPLSLHVTRTGNDGKDGTNAELPYTDYGLVTSLPASPSVGDRCIFKANESVFWLLVYDGQGSYPWKKVGGPPIVQYEPTARSTTSTSYQTTGAPYVTTPLAGDYDVAAGAERISMPTNVNSIGRVGLHYNGLLIFEALGRGNEYSAYPAYAHRRLTGLAKGATLQSRYRAELEKAEFVTLFVQIDPVRVG